MLRKQSNVKTEYQYPVLSLHDFAQQKELGSAQLEKMFFEEELSEEYFAREGDVIVRLNKPYGAKLITSSVAGKKMLVPSAFLILRPRKDMSPRYVPGYLVWLLNSPETLSAFNRKAMGSLLRPIVKRDLAELEINASLDVQQRIADLWDAAQREHELLAELAEVRLKLAHAAIDQINREGGLQ